MKRCTETTYSSRKRSKHDLAIVEIEALFDFGHVLLKKPHSGKNGAGGDNSNPTQGLKGTKSPTRTDGAPISPGDMMAANSGTTLSWTSASTVNDEQLDNKNEIVLFSCLDLDYDYELPPVNLESDLKLMDKLFSCG